MHLTTAYCSTYTQHPPPHNTHPKKTPLRTDSSAFVVGLRVASEMVRVASCRGDLVPSAAVQHGTSGMVKCDQRLPPKHTHLHCHCQILDIQYHLRLQTHSLQSVCQQTRGDDGACDLMDP